MIDRNRIAAIAAKAGLKAILGGHRLNTSYTPKRCMEVAREFTGKNYKAKDYQQAIDGIQMKLNDLDRAMIYAVAEQRYGDAGVNAIEASCLTVEDFKLGWEHCLTKILPALEKELTYDGG